MRNKAENNGEVLKLLDWVTGDVTNKDNKYKMKKRFWEKESEQR